MNLVDCKVLKILSEPYYQFNHWFVQVEYESYGKNDITSIMFDTKEKAEQVKVGFVFEA
ncbi:hypothetical protein HZQ28_01165 [Elizabethkingia anophelis]|uniref:hypothetical protein n=1 Tax=Elizabethkingia anophelis TaxID=1117645 RepID=UPI0021A67399|nr:hypothetical protein [Elizabethkingia anophelis]MCT3943885.1 hypothetical protein [Elizabethkingia anophelis]MCT3978726.1 hypothetical protein [Elizabethkingia anophelis]MCT3993097.1 hypothetical protein [Elizabethkingia anophelis]MCT3997154.1 hypothetical protein [Elizabethkingia anophelis]